MPEQEAQDDRRSAWTQPWRYALAGLGVLLVGIGAVGAFVPGLPTTIFLIAASACFARSCPWMEDMLLSNRVFKPYMRYVNGERALTGRERAVTLLIMWTFVSISVLLLVRGDSPNLWIVFTVVAAAAVGSLFVVHWSPRRRPAPGTASCPIAPLDRAERLERQSD